MCADYFLDLNSADAAAEMWTPIVSRLRHAAHITILTGAGVSAESGLPTFRGGGLWESHRAEDVATPEAFERDPELVWRFYNHRREMAARVRPNAAHEAIRTLQDALPGRVTLVTQNVDGLHQAAGSENVLELHGCLRRVRCTQCGSSHETFDPLPPLPRCPCGGLQRPGVVWFGEALPEDVLTKAQIAACEGGAMLVAGTSAIVYPAAGLIDVAQSAGAFIVEINPGRTSATDQVNAILRGPAAKALPLLVEKWL